MQAHVCYVPTAPGTPPMTPAKNAAINLTDYTAQVASRVITPMQGTKELPSGTRQFRAELWHISDDREADHGAWTKSRGDAFAEAEALLVDLENGLEKAAETELAS